MNSSRSIFSTALWLAAIAAFAAALVRLYWFTPTEETMGEVQKIFYIHLPVAICAFVAALLVFIAGIGYLWQRSSWWDDFAAAAGKVTVLYCSIVLLTGMIWARSAWGQWWTWSPRLTFSLVLWLLYVVYLMIRPSIESPQRRALVCAVYGIIAFLDVPLVWLSTKLMPDIHPEGIALEPAMRTTLLFWFVPIVLLTIAAIRTQYRIHRVERALLEPQDEAASSASPATA